MDQKKDGVASNGKMARINIHLNVSRPIINIGNVQCLEYSSRRIFPIPIVPDEKIRPVPETTNQKHTRNIKQKRNNILSGSICININCNIEID